MFMEVNSFVLFSFLLGRIVVVVFNLCISTTCRFVPSSSTAGEVLAITATKWDSQETLYQYVLHVQ